MKDTKNSHGTNYSDTCLALVKRLFNKVQGQARTPLPFVGFGGKGGKMRF
jgi:hypothetical protein